MRKLVLFLSIILIASFSYGQSSYYKNEKLKIGFKKPVIESPYEWRITDHTEALKKLGVYDKYIENFDIDDSLDVIPFWPVEIVEIVKIKGVTIKITKSMGSDVYDLVVGREMTFIYKNRYITIRLIKRLMIGEKIEYNSAGSKKINSLKKIEIEDEKMKLEIKSILDTIEFY